MPRRALTAVSTLLLALAATVVVGLPAAAEVVAGSVTDASGSVSAPAATSAPTSQEFTSEDLARNASPASKWLWIAAPFAVAALWLVFSRLWRTPAPRG